jgi:hypothetical protein
MKQRDARWMSSLVNALKNLAEMRQASVSATTLVLYAGRLWTTRRNSPARLSKRY